MQLREVRNAIECLLDEYRVFYYNWPVPEGYGQQVLDYNCAVLWRGMHIAFWIVTAEAGKPPAVRKQSMIVELRNRKAKVFIIGSDVGVTQLRDWLEDVKRSGQR